MKNRNKFKYSKLSKKKGKGYRFGGTGDPCTDQYLKTAKSFRRITTEEEQEIIARIKNMDPESEKLKDILIKSHQPFIIMFAQRNCPNKSDLFMDLIQEGNYGMCVALERFDPSKNVKFLSYANAWIVKYMYEFLQNNELVKRKNRSKTWGVDSRLRDEYVRTHGYEPTCEELMIVFNEAGIKIKNPEDLQEISIISMDQPTNTCGDDFDDELDDDECEYGEYDRIEDRIDTADMAANIRKAMEFGLTEDEWMAVGMKFGFDGMDEFTNKEIAEFLETTTYRIKLLLDSAMEKLKYDLEGFLESA